MKKKQYRIICGHLGSNQCYVIQVRRRWLPIWKSVEYFASYEGAIAMLNHLRNGELHRSNWE